MTQRTGGFGKRNAAGNVARAPGSLARPKASSDKRAGGRAATYKNARVFIGGGAELDCAVRDVSAKGCMISLLGAENLPQEVTVKLDLISPRRRARVVWREYRDAGLEFLPDDED